MAKQLKDKKLTKEEKKSAEKKYHKDFKEDKFLIKKMVKKKALK
jgi:hypothetical protein